MYFPQPLFDVTCHCIYQLLIPSAYHACVCHAKAHSVIQISQMLKHQPVAFCWPAAEGRDILCVYKTYFFLSFCVREKNGKSPPFRNNSHNFI